MKDEIDDTMNARYAVRPLDYQAPEPRERVTDAARVRSFFLGCFASLLTLMLAAGIAAASAGALSSLRRGELTLIELTIGAAAFCVGVCLLYIFGFIAFLYFRITITGADPGKREARKRRS